MELRKIVVGMDEDPESVMALEEIIPVARKYGAEVILAHVGNVYDYPTTSMIAPEAIAHYQSLLAKRQKNVREKLAEIRERHSGQGVEISVSMLDGYPSVSIPDIEDELEADLVVVGSHGRTGLRRLWSGSVSERIVRRSRRPVLVARNAKYRNPYRRVLVAIDFKSASQQALEHAIALAAPEAVITLAHFWHLPPTGPDVGPGLGALSASIEDHARKKLDALKRRFEGDYVLQTEVTYGYAAEMIRESATNYDLISLGNRGRKGISRFLLGGSSRVETVFAISCTLGRGRRKKCRPFDAELADLGGSELRRLASPVQLGRS